MNSRIKTLNKQLKSHDSELFCQETRPGRLDIYRKSKWGDRPAEYIFSLTEDWTVNTRPVPWGDDIVINRIKAHDLWRDTNYINEIIKNLEKGSELKEKRRKSKVEDFLWDFAPQFAKATDSINTGTLNKIYRKET